MTFAKQLSASNAEAFVHCGASHVLPQHDVFHERTNRGNDGHAVLAAIINKSKTVGAMNAEGLSMVKAFPLAEVIRNTSPGTRLAEPAYVVNVKMRTTKFLGLDIDRKYEQALGRPLEKYEIPVSFDFEGVEDIPVSIDWKFGTHSTEWQRRIQAMANAWKHGAPSVRAGFCHIDPQTSGKEYELDYQTYYAYELSEYAGELVRAWDRVEVLYADLQAGKVRATEIRTAEGHWCSYCGAYPHCPSKWKLAKAMLDDVALIDSIDAMTLEQCGAVWAKWKEIKRLGEERIERVLKLRAEATGGLPLPNGKMLRVVQAQGRKSFDQDGAVSLLQQYGAPDVAISALYKRGQPYSTIKETKK